MSDAKCSLGGRLCPTQSVRWMDVCVRRKVFAGWTFVSDANCSLVERLCPTQSVRWVDFFVGHKNPTHTTKKQPLAVASLI